MFGVLQVQRTKGRQLNLLVWSKEKFPSTLDKDSSIFVWLWGRAHLSVSSFRRSTPICSEHSFMCREISSCIPAKGYAKGLCVRHGHHNLSRLSIEWMLHRLISTQMNDKKACGPAHRKNKANGYRLTFESVLPHKRNEKLKGKTNGVSRCGTNPILLLTYSRGR